MRSLVACLDPWIWSDWRLHCHEHPGNKLASFGCVHSLYSFETLIANNNLIERHCDLISRTFQFPKHLNGVTRGYFRLNKSLASRLFVQHLGQSNNKETIQASHYEPFVKRTTLQRVTWWRHEMETFSALLAICAGNSPIPGEFPTQRTVTRSFDVFFDLRLNKRLRKQSRVWWFETQSRPLWRHRNECSIDALNDAELITS